MRVCGCGGCGDDEYDDEYDNEDDDDDGGDDDAIRATLWTYVNISN